MALTYKKYLSLENLLELQKPRSSPPEHDETEVLRDERGVTGQAGEPG